VEGRVLLHRERVPRDRPLVHAVHHRLPAHRTSKAFTGFKSSGLRDPGFGICILRSGFTVQGLGVTVKPSVVGSGPMRMPGKFWPRSDRMKDVLPTEYCPSRST